MQCENEILQLKAEAVVERAVHRDHAHALGEQLTAVLAESTSSSQHLAVLQQEAQQNQALQISTRLANLDLVHAM